MFFFNFLDRLLNLLHLFDNLWCDRNRLLRNYCLFHLLWNRNRILQNFILFSTWLQIINFLFLILILCLSFFFLLWIFKRLIINWIKLREFVKLCRLGLRRLILLVHFIFEPLMLFIFTKWFLYDLLIRDDCGYRCHLDFILLCQGFLQSHQLLFSLLKLFFRLA